MALSRTPRRQLATIPDAAEYACVSTKTIRRRIASGDLTGYRMGPRLLRVDLDELDALLKPIPTARGGAA
ncbi:hypothetical protein GCM10027599_26710 [Yimella radicis]